MTEIELKLLFARHDNQTEEEYNMEVIGNKEGVWRGEIDHYDRHLSENEEIKKLAKALLKTFSDLYHCDIAVCGFEWVIIAVGKNFEKHEGVGVFPPTAFDAMKGNGSPLKEEYFKLCLNKENHVFSNFYIPLSEYHEGLDLCILIHVEDEFKNNFIFSPMVEILPIIFGEIFYNIW